MFGLRVLRLLRVQMSMVPPVWLAVVYIYMPQRLVTVEEGDSRAASS